MESVTKFLFGVPIDVVLMLPMAYAMARASYRTAQVTRAAAAAAAAHSTGSLLTTTSPGWARMAQGHTRGMRIARPKQDGALRLALCRSRTFR